MKDYKHLLKIKERFQPFIKNQDLLYTYIAPKDKDKYELFFNIAGQEPTCSSTMYEVLCNNKVLEKILNDLGFLNNSELEIYIASKDINTPIMINGTLKQYIERENIDFDY